MAATNVKPGSYMKSIYNAVRALGDKVVASDAVFEIEGEEHLSLLIKQFPWPELSPGGEIEVPMPNGGAHWQAQQIKVHQQGQITFLETQEGHIQEFLERVIRESNGTFNATVYEGNADDYSRKCEIRNCFVQLENPDRDWENRGQVMQISGTLFFHYFGSET